MVGGKEKNNEAFVQNTKLESMERVKSTLAAGKNMHHWNEYTNIDICVKQAKYHQLHTNRSGEG